MSHKQKTNLNRIIYDWVSISSKCCSVQNFIELLGMDNPSIVWTNTYGFYGYKDRMYFGGISIHYNGHNEDMGVLLELSGQGCRTFEEHGHGDYQQLFNLVIDEPEDCRITRLDVAYDDFNQKLDLDTISSQLFNDTYVCNSGKFNVQHGTDGYSCDIGRKSSNTYLRIYDKKQEQGKDDILHWIRFELQLRAENAFSFISASSGNIGHKFFAYVNKFIRFVDPSETDSNKRRWDMSEWWRNFIEHLEKFKTISKGEKDYGLYRLSKYIFEQAGNSIETYIEIKGFEAFLKELAERTSTLKPHHIALINEYSAI